MPHALLSTLRNKAEEKKRTNAGIPYLTIQVLAKVMEKLGNYHLLYHQVWDRKKGKGKGKKEKWEC